MGWLNYHHLYYFRVIANEGGIAKASEKLRIGQPTLSTQLKQLEDSLGKSLFERRNRRLFLTDAGRVALEYANEIFGLGEEMVEALADRLKLDSVHVQIGALDSVAKKMLLELTQHTYSQGKCSISILEGKGDELFRELFAHKLDLLLTNYPPPLVDQEKVFARSIARLPVVVCGAEKFNPLRKSFPESLAGQPFILPTHHSQLRYDLDQFFKSKMIQLNPIAETQDTSLQNLLGVSGVGLIALSESSAEELIRDKKLVSIGKLTDVEEEIWLVSASRRIANPIAAQVMKSFKLT